MLYPTSSNYNNLPFMYGFDNSYNSGLNISSYFNSQLLQNSLKNYTYNSTGTSAASDVTSNIEIPKNEEELIKLRIKYVREGNVAGQLRLNELQKKGQFNFGSASQRTNGQNQIPAAVQQNVATSNPACAEKNLLLEGGVLGLDKAMADSAAKNFRRSAAFGENVKALGNIKGANIKDISHELSYLKDELKVAEELGDKELIEEFTKKVSQKQALFDKGAAQLQKSAIQQSKAALKNAKLKQEFFKKFLKLTQKGDNKGMAKLFAQKKYAPFIKEAKTLNMKLGLKPQNLEQAIEGIIKSGKKDITKFGQHVKIAKATSPNYAQAQAAKEAVKATTKEVAKEGAKATTKEAAKAAAKAGFWKTLGKNMAEQFPKTAKLCKHIHMPKWLGSCGKALGTAGSKTLFYGGKILGKAAWPLAIGLEAVDVCKTANKYGLGSKQTAKSATKATCGLAGAAVGAKAGAALGATIGAFFGGVGAAPGAVIGGIIGGAVGYFTGSKTADVAFDAVAGKTECEA